MNNYTSKILLREDFQKKDGTSPIYLRLTINRRTKKYSLNISSKAEWWDFEISRIKRGDILKFKKNNLIDKAEKRAKDIIYDFRDKHVNLTFEEFESRYYNEQKDCSISDSFYDFAKQEIEILFRSGGSKETYRGQKSYISKLKKYRGSKLSFGEIDLKFLESYREYMIIELKNSHNTWVRSFAFIKSIINKAIRKGVIKENVFKNFSFSGKDGNREFLTINEVELLEKMVHDPNTSKAHKRALIPFIFSCYTGLRYTDIYNLKHKNVIVTKSEGKERKFIRIVMHKTKEKIEIPLASQAIKLLPNNGFDEQKVFKVYTNQAQNRYLKEITKKIGINKHLSFHCARHTFATLLLSLDVHIEVVSKLLGHTNLKTTQIYAKVLPESKLKAIDKINKLVF